ncbi:NAD(P)H dehydrogenase (quinone) [Pseudooceanicola antarcticus]|uniref:NAD(P)-dependent oxidoreductase n=1 Tax=Pseudooceanicola antarcticus TaxID=1247613 RepID=A0A285J5S1_9RHOB|nr:NAD(P)H-binding protein [Pseudooceanicola antarcticus]PJE26876.1 NAD(P)-dependent oxidoreductase [Pseudooceanicola antarcticus]SNY55624.1 NAD(P)H dehydrogenase (quinone) [Pseudooceanicola antarcticus]
MSKKILVTGASGQLGALVIDSLLSRTKGSDIVALVRREEAAAALRAKGVEVRLGDYEDPAALAAAVKGVDRVLLISGSEVGKDRPAQHGNVIEAARAEGVELIAYTSILHADESPLWLAEDHKATEALLVQSGLPTALLRNGWYTENLTAGLAPALEAGALIGASGEGRYSPAARADYAEAAAVVLLSDAPAGIYELAGGESFSMAEFAAEVSAVTGREIGYADLPEPALKEVYTGAGLPEVVAHMLADSSANAASGALEGSGAQLEALIGRPATDWRDTLRAALA